MKLVVLISRFPWPLEKGDKLRIFHQIKDRARRHDVYVFCLAEDEPATDHIEVVEKYASGVRYFRISKWRRMANAFLSLLNGKPAQLGYFLDRKIKKKIRSEIISINPDRVYCQLIRAAEYAKMLPFPKVLDYMDSFSAGMRRQAETRTFPVNLFYRLESLYTRRYEHEVYKYFDESLIISAKDRDELPLISKNSVHVIPNGIDTVFFHPDPEVEKKYDVAFIGNLGYKPNEQAVEKLHEWIEQIEPAKRPSVLIAGARPTARILKLQSDYFHITGWVDDIRQAYNSAKVFAAPLFTGSGLQNKILEAMSCGLACITTSLVNDSIGAKAGKEIVICDDQASFVQALDKLLKHSSYREDIVQAGSQYVKDNFSWDNYNEQLDQLIVNAKMKSEQYAY